MLYSPPIHVQEACNRPSYISVWFFKTRVEAFALNFEILPLMYQIYLHWQGWIETLLYLLWGNVLHFVREWILALVISSSQITWGPLCLQYWVHYLINSSCLSSMWIAIKMVEMVILSALHNFLKNVRNYDSTLQCCKIGSFLTLFEYNADFNGKK